MTNHVNDAEPRHPSDELAGLVAGELGLDDLRAVTRHLRSCAQCQAELVEVAAGLGALRGVEREGLAQIDEAPPMAVVPLGVVPVTGSARTGRNRPLFLAVAAALVLVVLLSAGLLFSRRGNDTEPPLAGPTVVLNPIGTVDAHGSVHMTDTGPTQVMTVDSKLPSAPSGSFYEVWLLQPQTGQMLAVGVLPNGGTADYALPTDIVGRYQAVDISLQPDNGVTTHSADSVLRATYA